MKVAIAGFGVEGRANYEYWSSFPENEVVIFDERTELEGLPVDAQAVYGQGAFESLADFDLVVRTAGLSPRKLKTNGKVWSATNEFFEKCPAKIIGVTGSKGKGTTSGLIVSILEAAGKKVWFVGNIGLPSLSVLSQIDPDDIVVYELSSFQLWDLEKSPSVAVVLHIEQEHLNVHDGMQDYVEAKSNIARHQHDCCSVIYNINNEHSQQIAELSLGNKVPYPSERHAHIIGDDFYYGEELISSASDLKLVGEHNRQNALAAIDAAWIFTQDLEAFRDGLADFKGLPHRLSFVKSVDGVDYYDDSIATTPSSAIAALKSFEGREKVIILGGSSKGSDFSELANEMLKHDVKAILIGSEAESIAESFDNLGFANYRQIQNASMKDIVSQASGLASEGAVVLLSPGAASFDDFKDYADRGEQFIEAVEAL